MNNDARVPNESEAFLGLGHSHTGDPPEGVENIATEAVKTRSQRNSANKTTYKKTLKPK